MFASSLSANWNGREPDSLLWLASYPRSGNTFTRILLANYFADDTGPYDINKLAAFAPSDGMGALWRDFLGDRPPPTTIEEGWALRPDFIRHYRKSILSSSVPALKTHTANVGVFGKRGLDLKTSDRTIYLVRHPLDVLLSYADFNGQDIEAALEAMTASGACMLTDLPDVAEVRGSWAEHVSSWITASPCPVLLVRYEELRANTEQILKDMLNFMGAPVERDRIRRAVDASRFERLREQEVSHKFGEASDLQKSGRFFRKGTSFQWLRDLTPDQAYRLSDACEPIMGKLGYTHPREVFFDGRNALQPVHLQS